MAKIDLSNNGLVVDIPGTASVLGVTYTRKFQVTRMSYNIVDKNVVVDGVIKFYDGQDVVITTSKIAKAYSVSVVADNLDYVDAQTGELLCKVAEEFTDSPSNTVLNPVLVGKDYVEQFDWFFNVGQNVDIKVNEMITSFVLTSAAKGEFD